MRRPPQLAPVLGVLYAALAVGCTGLLKSTARPEQVYYLRAPALEGAPSEDGAAGNAPSGDGGAARSAAAGTADPSGAATRPHRGLGTSLRVGHPVANPGLDSTHIMLIEADHRMNFFAGSRWPGPVAGMVEALAVEALRSSGAWSSVEDSTSPFPSEYLLQVAVRRFEADYTVGG
ncbi:MAG TPA: ABC-type transport auxiliary lipoprotein family protein, partial [Steroidobacteraceae bacterium]|nr:ABC-type transport auxiliary lipoprotein family protein [Steroidobacteraceae bacterium]